MRILYSIALNTFSESIRNKILFTIFGFAAAIIILSISFGEWSVFARVQVMEDFGLATMSIAGLMLAVFIGVGLLGREIESKTAYAILVKPIPRFLFVLGKYFGLCATLLLTFSLMAIVFCATIAGLGGGLSGGVIVAIALIGVEMMIIVAVSILFSVYTTPMLAALFTFGFYCIGHFNDLVDVNAIEKTAPLLALILKGLYMVIPNLEHFNIRAQVVYNTPLTGDYVLSVVLYGILFVMLFLLVASSGFSRKDV